MEQPTNVSFSNSIINFFQEQLAEWPLAERNHEALKNARMKVMDLGGSSVRIQFNPERMLSTVAKTDTESVQERNCFLCSGNLPVEQRSILYSNDYQILVNPYPIFPIHLTVPTRAHLDQLIFDRYGDMLDIAASLSDFVVFYNGPKCGASAPDHMHFQAGSKGFLTIENDILSQKRAMIISSEVVRCYSLLDYYRNVIVIESQSKKDLVALFHRIYASLELNEGEKEPMLNIVSWYDNGKWISCMFPRKVHRPKCFYASGEKNLLFSPASVDLSGVCVLPMEKDFNKITAEDAKNVFKEICIDDDAMKSTVHRIIDNFNSYMN